MTTATAIDKQALLTGIPGYDPVTTAPEGSRFDEERAQLALDFFAECLHFIEGKRAGTPFALEPWQAAIVGNIFGWRMPDGFRRYRRGLLYVPRKNGKTPLAAGILLALEYLDQEAGAQLYSAAADKEQAALIYRHASEMIAADPDLAERARIYRSFKSIEFRDNRGIYRALAADAHRQHGKNIHAAIIEELHAHPNRELYDALRTATGTRDQPFILCVTTADFDRPSICNTEYAHAVRVRDGQIDDPRYLPVIYEAGREDDWEDEIVWAKANPNLGVSLHMDYLREAYREAKEDPTFENTFRRLHLNQRTEQSVRWIPMDDWDECAGALELEALAGKPCIAGLDLANADDLAAFVLVFEVPGPGREDGASPDANEFHVLAFCWAAEETAHNRERKTNIPYATWARQGLIELTPGNACDFSHIRHRIGELGKTYDIQEIAYDPWNASHLAMELQEEDGFAMVQFRQGFASMNEPSKGLIHALRSRRVRHGGNALLRWCASNAVARTDPAGNIKPDKEKSPQKIDPLVAMVMALGRYLVGERTGPSVYEERGITRL